MLEFFKYRMDNKNILNTLNKNRSKIDKDTDKIRFLKLIFTERFKINNKVYAEAAMQAGIIFIAKE